VWKITFFFSQYNFTWTETYYLPGNYALTQVVTVCTSLATARAACNGNETYISAIRCVNLASPRRSFFLVPGTYSSRGQFSSFPAQSPDQDSAPQFMALQIKFYGVAGQICRRYMAGIPEGQFGTVFGAKDTNVNGLMNNALTSFVAALNGNGFSFRFTNQAGHALAGTPTTSAQFPGEIGLPFGTQIISVTTPQPYKIYLNGFRKVNTRLFGLGGVYTVDPASPGITAAVAPYTYYLRNTSNVQPSNIAQTGFGAALVYGYDVFSSNFGPSGTGYSILGANHRKRGVSALSLRGRSRSKP